MKMEYKTNSTSRKKRRGQDTEGLGILNRTYIFFQIILIEE